MNSSALANDHVWRSFFRDLYRQEQTRANFLSIFAKLFLRQLWLSCDRIVSTYVSLLKVMLTLC